MHHFHGISLCVFLVAHGVSGGIVAGPSSMQSLQFRRHVINEASEFSACAVFDVNKDGHPDIFCGGFWYAGPDWKRSITRDVPNIRGRYDDYSNLPIDVNGDGWVDVLSVNYRSASIYWIEHPGPSFGVWQTRLIDSPGPSETGRLYDIDGDGQADLLPNGTNYAAWYARRVDEEGATTWVRQELPAELAGHGIGFGDVDGDGCGDLVGPKGWYRVPQDAPRNRWIAMNEFRLHRDCSVPIVVHDVDEDGDQDIIWARAHNIGLYWMEQQPAFGGGRRWVQHAIDTSWSSSHSLLLADLDGNGRKELIAGKRYLGHGGRDPGEIDPLVVYRYEFSPADRVWQRQLISWGGICGFDLDPKFADVDLDGDIDIVAPTRVGLCLLENLGVQPRAPTEDKVTENVEDVFEYAASDSILVRRHSSDRLVPVQTQTDWGYRRWQTLRNMEKVMGRIPGPEQRVSLDVRVEREEQAEGYRRLKLTYAADPEDRVPAYLLIPNDTHQPRPAALCLHPTHRLGKSQVCGLGGNPNYAYAHELAQRGYICLAPDYAPFGDYDDYDYAREDIPYVSGTMKAIWNNVRALDLLEAMSEVDRDRIVCLGHSLGGHNSLFTAAFDQRIRAVMTSCGFTAFSHYYDGDLRGWTSDRYMPRIKTHYDLAPDKMPFDFHEILAAIAPRPVFISAPDGDGNFAQSGVKLSVERALPVFQLFEAPERLFTVYPQAQHELPDAIRQQFYEWLDENL